MNEPYTLDVIRAEGTHPSGQQLWQPRHDYDRHLFEHLANEPFDSATTETLLKMKETAKFHNVTINQIS